jgi:hypothetical protein
MSSVNIERQDQFGRWHHYPSLFVLVDSGGSSHGASDNPHRGWRPSPLLGSCLGTPGISIQSTRC